PTPAEPAPAEPGVLFSSAPERGADLETSLDERTQRLAEDVLSEVGPASALVALQPSTGSVLAAAEGPGADGQAIATTGQYAPGSTFKIISALALLRSGLEPSSTVSCPRTVTVDGRTFENYDDYPADQLGEITLQQAVAHSCNTAFIGERDQLTDFDLARAAGSLGIGLDHDLGFPAYFGAVPEDETETGRAAAMIGQGKVLASPLAMAGVAASVAAGETVLPRLVDASVSPNAEPLTEAEAAQLAEMMRSVVTDGSSRFLSDLSSPSVGAKTGTAEYGDTDPPATHAWMIATRGDLAVAVFVADGESGSQTAGPLLEEFLERL
ncbi:MAG: penicillin-binding transpeptidase domain-containing protein, partial [Propionibacteriaceae bacterium]